jgi:hypothetical protein
VIVDLVRRHRFALIVFAACWLVLFVWWLAFFPVLISPDSLTYVKEATTNQWSTDHSVVYDAIIWVSLQATRGVGVLTFLQFTAFAAVLAYIASGLLRLGARPWAVGVCAVIGLFAPSLGSFPVYLWKDVPFALGALWLLGLLIRLVDVAEHEPDWPRSARARRLVIWSFVAVVVACLSRNNAFIFMIITAIGLLIVWRRAALRIAGAVLLGAVVATVLTVAVFPALGVQRAKSDLVLGPAYDDIAYVYKGDPHALSAKDRALLAEVAPLSLWRDAGNCYTADDLTNTSGFSRNSASAHSGQLFALWRKLLVAHPGSIVKARMCRGFIAWSPVAGPPGRGGTVFPLTHEPERRFAEIKNPTWQRALRPAPISSSLRSALARYDVNSRGWQDVIWRGATWSYVLYLCIAVAIWRTRRWSLLALATIPLGVQIGVLVDNPNQLVRYMIVPLYAGVLLLPLLTLRAAPVEPLEPAAQEPPLETQAEDPRDPAPRPG